jgi:hypothetical protein
MLLNDELPVLFCCTICSPPGQVNYFLIHVFLKLYSGIQKQLSTSSALRKILAFMFIKISLTYMEMKRIYEV